MAVDICRWWITRAEQKYLFDTNLMVDFLLTKLYGVNTETGFILKIDKTVLWFETITVILLFSIKSIKEEISTSLESN